MFGLPSGLREEVISILECLNSTGHTLTGTFIMHMRVCSCGCAHVIIVVFEKNHKHDLVRGKSISEYFSNDPQ